MSTEADQTKGMLLAQHAGLLAQTLTYAKRMDDCLASQSLTKGISGRLDARWDEVVSIVCGV